ncbi:MAG: hypothetical protein AAGE59_25710 [Cyanobacteria bacterium P01_F01_bin.86]
MGHSKLKLYFEQLFNFDLAGISQAMGFWLYPASQPTSQKTDWLGTGMLAGALLLTVLLFNWVVQVI